MIDNPMEKLFTWSPEKIRWYNDACEYPDNSRNRILAEAILDELPSDPDVCDIGCGIGALSLELAKKSAKVTAVDINRDALDQLRRTIALNHIGNIEVVEGDFRALSPPAIPSGCVVFCMFGNIDYLKYAELWTSGKIIIIACSDKKRTFFPNLETDSRQDADEIRVILKNSGYCVRESAFRVSFGQPFRDFEDAVSFIACYRHESSRDNIIGLLEKSLVKTGRSDFPLYLPSEKTYVMFSFQAH